MRLVVVEGVEPGGVAGAVDARTYARGALLARRHAVVEMDWDGRYAALHTVVRDEATFHEAVVCFVQRGARLHFAAGTCTCRVGTNCAHVVASVLTSVGGGEAAAGAEQQPSWERTLRSLFAPEPPSLADLRNPVPLALELSLSAARVDSVTLSARIVRPGRTGWVAGGLTWHSVASPYPSVDCDVTHARVLRELYALHNAGSGYHYGGYDRTIDLATVGRGLWSVLDEAADVGLQVVHARKRLGAVDRHHRAELCLDVTAGPAPEALEIAPALRLDGADGADADALPVLFLGADGHGVVHVSRAEAEADPDPGHWRFRLARLATPAPPALRRLVVEDGGFSVAGDQRRRFLDEFYPRLRRLAPVASSDASFTPPPVPAPTLVLRAAYGGGHTLALEWEWAYLVGETQARYPLPLPAADDTVRDAAQERAVLEALDLPPFADVLLRADGPRSPLLPRVRLDGLDTMRFSTEVLPLLADAPGRRRRGHGPACRLPGGGRLAAGRRVHQPSRRGGTDWFDLGVRISVEGPRRPVLGGVRRPRRGGDAPAPAGRGVLLPAQAGAAGVAHAHRGGARAAGLAIAVRCGSAASRRACGRSWPALGVVEPRRGPGSSRSRACWRSTGSRPPHCPAHFRAQLRPYQREGVDWLCFLWRHRLGGVLADDMGLGKTVQTLALICHAREVEPAGDPFLIVAPTSVVPNWAAEAARFARGCGSSPSPTRCAGAARSCGRRSPARTSWSPRTRCSGSTRTAYGAAAWAGLVLDEAQFAKNHQSKVYQCARRFPAPFKLAITGTPMENNLMELWSLLSITAPGLFPSPTGSGRVRAADREATTTASCWPGCDAGSGR